MKPAKKATSTPAATPAKATTHAAAAIPAPALLKTAHIAKRHGMRPQALRRILRAMPDYADGVFTRYGWDPTNPKHAAQLTAIDARIKQLNAAKIEAATAAQAAIAPAKA